MNAPEISLACVANVYIRHMSFKEVGDTEVGHTHAFDHVTYLSRGAIRITVDGITKDFHERQMILIKAHAVHELVALEANTEVSCIHALRDGEGMDDIIAPDAVIDDETFIQLRKKIIQR